MILGACQLSSLILSSYFSVPSLPPSLKALIHIVLHKIILQSGNLWLTFQSTSTPARGHMCWVVAYTGSAFSKTKVFQSLNLKNIPNKNVYNNYTHPLLISYKHINFFKITILPTKNIFSL